MLFGSSYSQLYAEYPVYFLILCGFCLTWITAIFNLNSTAGAKFNWLFLEPFIFLGFIYFDQTKMIDKATCAGLYVGFFAVIMVRYLMLMRNIVNQITTHMGLSFLKVKPTGKTRQDWLNNMHISRHKIRVLNNHEGDVWIIILKVVDLKTPFKSFFTL